MLKNKTKTLEVYLKGIEYQIDEIKYFVRQIRILLELES